MLSYEGWLNIDYIRSNILDRGRVCRDFNNSYSCDVEAVAGTEMLNVTGLNANDDGLIFNINSCILELTSAPDGNWSTLLRVMSPPTLAPLETKVRSELLSFRYGAVTIADPVSGTFNCLFSIITTGSGFVL